MGIVVVFICIRTLSGLYLSLSFPIGQWIHNMQSLNFRNSISIFWYFRHWTNRNSSYSLMCCRVLSVQRSSSYIYEIGLVCVCLRISVWVSCKDGLLRFHRGHYRARLRKNPPPKLTGPVYSTEINECHCNTWWYRAHAEKVREGRGGSVLLPDENAYLLFFPHVMFCHALLIWSQ